jgi:hypothetical protein
MVVPTLPETFVCTGEPSSTGIGFTGKPESCGLANYYATGTFPEKVYLRDVETLRDKNAFNAGICIH